MKEINDSNKDNSDYVKGFHSVYSSEFSEEYLFYKTMAKCMLSTDVKLSGKEIKIKYKIDGEPDYYVRKGNRIFLFESKDVMLNAEIKSSFDYTEIETALISKFVESEQKPKAILQLINQIRKVLSKQNPYDKEYNSNNLSIYPIIVVHDRIFNTSGLNVIVNDWFQTHLQNLSIEGYFINNIKSLIIIDIDTLLYHQDLFNKRSIELGNIIDEYIKYTNKFGNVRSSNQAKPIQLYGGIFEPFSIYLSNYVKRKFNKYYPDLLISQANKLFKT